MITVTNVTVRPVNSKEGKVVAFADITIDDSFLVNNVKIINGQRGLFVAMPAIKDKKTDTYKDVCFPLNNEARKIIETKVLAEYRKGNDIDI